MPKFPVRRFRGSIRKGPPFGAAESEGRGSYVSTPRDVHLTEALGAALLTGTGGGIAAVAVGMPWAALLGAGTIGTAAWLVNRAFRISLEASDECVLVSNYWRDYEFVWLDVVRVAMGEVATGPTHQPAIAFQLRNGKWIKAQATPQKRSQWPGVFDALETLAPPSVEVIRPDAHRP